MLLTLVVGTTTGCATTTWQHTRIPDKEAADQQFAIDDAYCTQASFGSVPMPQVVYNDVSPKTSTLTLSGSTYNTMTGARTYGTYQGYGTTTPSPGAAFAGGFANGVNLGNAIAAKRARERIYKGCMYAKGWTEVKAGAHPSSMASSSASSQSSNHAEPPVIVQLYDSRAGALRADTEEFMVLFPAYMESTELNEALFTEVRRIALHDPDASGPSVLLRAHKEILRQTSVPLPSDQDHQFIASVYEKAAAGDSLSQTMLGMAYMQGDGPLSANYKRALVWLGSAALAGNEVAQVGYGILLFYGKGIDPDRTAGYQWVAKAFSSGHADAKKFLEMMEADMTAEERRKLALR